MLDTLAPIAAEAGALLIARRQTIAVADGATGGLILAGLLTVPGATRFCRGGGVVYSLRGRDVLLGLPRDAYAGMESVTEAYAMLQAEAIRVRFGADWAVAESGAAGPDRHPRGAPIGRSCIAVAGPAGGVATTFESGIEDRIANMAAFAQAALRFVVDVLDAAPTPDGDERD
ncbi:CinA family protein [Sphingomonas sp. NBWT7]|uniref:CinA family protein n=1 Tax=Sphingomonas sp. NBWT7 TaxID=2596913 RepID=UPI001623AFF2|nr:CinA family protein [Sphingomonas sp. NBWT7]QNE32927.1 CinA family protein [Sphingomonas sp. NBWT7]